MRYACIYGRHCACKRGESMKQLTIRDVPEDVVQMLREEAAEHGHSLNTVVRTALAEHADRRRRAKRFQEALPRLDALREQIRREHGGDLSDSTELIREDRTAGDERGSALRC